MIYCCGNNALLRKPISTRNKGRGTRQPTALSVTAGLQNIKDLVKLQQEISQALSQVILRFLCLLELISRTNMLIN
jgi:hypothetical protein